MKKILAATFGIIIGLTSLTYAAPTIVETYLQNDFLIKVDGEFKYHPEGLKPLVYENRTYLPAAYIAQLLGASTTFDSQTKTVNIVSKSQSDENEDEILEYENRIKELEEKIKKLESSTSTSSDYSKLPVRITKNGYKLKLEGFSIDDDEGDGRLYFTLENDDVDTGLKINIMATTIEADGITYKAAARDSSFVDLKSFNWIELDDDMSTYIPFKDLPKDNDIKEMTITVEIQTNQYQPKKEYVTFKVVND
ncbi:stalk domain-containing protein [Acetoanaerobium noterae]|uniref:stalk domain-containing protein n=1 Tax=Acetoanaerobium noterae TaxID=745369 RepID=UPI0028ABC486|nr:stalk domain-containing protein [Acetoanaerobium noterae]